MSAPTPAQLREAGCEFALGVLSPLQWPGLREAATEVLVRDAAGALDVLAFMLIQVAGAAEPVADLEHLTAMCKLQAALEGVQE